MNKTEKFILLLNFILKTENKKYSMDNNLAYRRKYPLNQKGAKEEWLGIHQHQLEIQEELQTVEKDIKDLKKNTLL